MSASNKYLLWLWLSFVLAGLLEHYYPQGTEDARGIAVAHSFLIMFLIFAWCGHHAVENDIGSVGVFKIFAAILPPVGVPVYFFKYFGLKRGGVLTMKALGVLLVLAVSSAVPYAVISYASV